jgi:hypothetical protein
LGKSLKKLLKGGVDAENLFKSIIALAQNNKRVSKFLHDAIMWEKNQKTNTMEGTIAFFETTKKSAEDAIKIRINILYFIRDSYYDTDHRFNLRKEKYLEYPTIRDALKTITPSKVEAIRKFVNKRIKQYNTRNLGITGKTLKKIRKIKD